MNVYSDIAVALDPSIMMEAAGMEADKWQADLLRDRPQRALLLAARQGGKSTVVSAAATHEALYHAPALILLTAPSERQSKELFRKVKDFYYALGEPVPADTSNVLSVELENGSRIAALPGKEKTIRGFSGPSLVIIDEAARVDDELYKSVRPMLAASGGRIMGLSTPFGRRGWFHEEWTGNNNWTRIRITAADCPRITPEFLEEERKSLGKWWYEQEYECVFNDVVNSLFSYEDLMAAESEEVRSIVIDDLIGSSLPDPEDSAVEHLAI